MWLYVNEGKADSPAVARFRSRYFVLTEEGVLTYYQNENESSIPAKVQGLITMQGAIIQRSSKADTGQEHSFSIMPSQLLPEEYSTFANVKSSDTIRSVNHAFTLSAPDSQTKDDWLTLLENEVRCKVAHF